MRRNGRRCCCPSFYFLEKDLKNVSERKLPMAFSNLKGSRQPESRVVGNVSICPNVAWTVAIDVLFSLNFAVVFDVIHFRFRHSKAK